jgi:hypothetical protein
MTTEILCFYLQNRLIRTSKTGSQWYNDTSHFSITFVLLIKTLLIKTLLIRTLLIRTLLVRSLLIKTLLIKTLLIKTLLIKTLLIKTLLIKTLLIKTLLIKTTSVLKLLSRTNALAYSTLSITDEEEKKSL